MSLAFGGGSGGVGVGGTHFGGVAGVQPSAPVYIPSQAEEQARMDEVSAAFSGLPSPKAQKKAAAQAALTGATTGGAAGQAAALAPPVPVNTNIQQDPNIKKVQDEYQKYLGELPANNDQFATNSLQRQRDLISGMEAEGTANAAARGFSADTGVSAAGTAATRDAGMRSLADLNAQNVAGGRAAEAGVLAGASGLASAGAGAMLGQENYALNQSKYQQDTINFQAQLQAMRDQNAFQNMIGLLNAQSSFYSGF